MRWSEEVTLIKQISPDQKTNKHGFKNPATTEKTTIFANEISIGTNEFYKASKEGYNKLIKLEIYAEEFNGAEKAEYNGAEYYILRTYNPLSKPDLTEITLSDLPRGGGRSG